MNIYFFFFIMGMVCIYYLQDKMIFVMWKYDQIIQDIFGLKNGMGWNSSFMLLIVSNGGFKMINWDGCIEECVIVSGMNFILILVGVKDFDIDIVFVVSDKIMFWGLVFFDVIYMCQGIGISMNNWNCSMIILMDEYGNGLYYVCL